jgi:hypothetical protein
MKKIFYISILAASTVLTGCDDLFEPATENHRQLESMWSEPSFAQGILANAYILLPYQTAPQSDLATDDAVTNELTSNYLRMATGSWAAENNPIDQWRDRFNAINYCNIMIANCDKVKWAESEVLSSMYRDHFLGESYALRALNYYYLLRAHAGYTDDGQLMGVPLILTPLDATMDKAAFNIPRSTFRDCVAQINNDIANALSLLQYEDGSIKNESDVPAKYKAIGATMSDYNRAFGDHMKGKINGRIVEGIRAQVAFLASSSAYAANSGVTVADAANLLAVALDRINGVAGVSADGYKWFADNSGIDNLKAGQNPDEIMWRAGRGGSNDHNLEDDHFPPSMYGKGRCNPTQNLVDAFPMANGYPIDHPNSGYNAQDPYAGRDPRLAANILYNEGQMGNTTVVTGLYGTTRDVINKDNGSSTRTGYYLRKWLRSDVNLNPSSVTGKYHYTPYIRYTELFLDYAEAANAAWGPKNGGTHAYSAYDVIKAIRQRAGVGGATDPYLEECAQSQSKMEELIRNERRLELCFENHRFFDLRRWMVTLPKLNETVRGMEIDKLADGTLTYTVLPNVEIRNYKDYMYYGPIPFSEIRKYDALKQNRGW